MSNHNNNSINEPATNQRFVQVYQPGTQFPHQFAVPTIVHRTNGSDDSSPSKRIILLEDFEHALNLGPDHVVAFFRDPNQDHPINIYRTFIMGDYIHCIENEVLYFNVSVIDPEGNNSATDENEVEVNEEQVVPAPLVDIIEATFNNDNEEDQVVPKASYFESVQDSFDNDGVYDDHSVYKTSSPSPSAKTYLDPTQTLPDFKKGGDDHSTPTPPPPALYLSTSNSLPSSSSTPPPAKIIPTSPSPVVFPCIKSEKVTSPILSWTKMEHTSPILFPSRMRMENASFTPSPSPSHYHPLLKSKLAAATNLRDRRRVRRLRRIRDLEETLRTAHESDASLKLELRRQRQKKQLLQLELLKDQEKIQEQKPLIVYTNTGGSSNQQLQLQQLYQQQRYLQSQRQPQEQQLQLRQPQNQGQSLGQGLSYNQYREGYTYSRSHSNGQTNHHGRRDNGGQGPRDSHRQSYCQGQCYGQGQSYGQPQNHGHVISHDQGYNHGRAYYNRQNQSCPYPNQSYNYQSQNNSYPSQNSNYPTQRYSNQTQRYNCPSSSSSNYPIQIYNNYPTQSTDYCSQSNIHPSQSSNYPTLSSNSNPTQSSINYPTQSYNPRTSQVNHLSQVNNHIQGRTATTATAATSTRASWPNTSPSDFQSYLTDRFGYSRDGSLGVHDQRLRRIPFPFAQSQFWSQPRSQQRLLSAVPQGQDQRHPQAGGNAGAAGSYQSVQSQAQQAQAHTQDQEQQEEPSKKRNSGRSTKRKLSSEADGSASMNNAANEYQKIKGEEKGEDKKKPLKRSRPSEEKDKGKRKEDEGKMSEEINDDTTASFSSNREQENLSLTSESKFEEENKKEEEEDSGASSDPEPENLPDTDMNEYWPIAARTRSRSSISSCTWLPLPDSRRKRPHK